jgi:hypothetical protein
MEVEASPSQSSSKFDVIHSCHRLLAHSPCISIMSAAMAGLSITSCSLEKPMQSGEAS